VARVHTVSRSGAAQSPRTLDTWVHVDGAVQPVRLTQHPEGIRIVWVYAWDEGVACRCVRVNSAAAASSAAIGSFVLSRQTAEA
jgi:hypothetical protein